MDLGRRDRLATMHNGVDGAEEARSLPPLAVSGLMITKAALIQALRAYVPQHLDVEPLDGGRFLLRLTGADQDEQRAQEKE